MSSKPHTIKVAADFSDLTRMAAPLQKSMKDALKEATKNGLVRGYVSKMEVEFRKTSSKLSRDQRKLEAYRYREALENEGKLDRGRQRSEKRLYSLREKISKASDAKEKKKYEKDLKRAEKLHQVLVQSSEEFSKNLTSATEELRETTNSLKNVSKYMNGTFKTFAAANARTDKRRAAVKEYFSADGEFADRVSASLEDALSKITSFDTGSAVRGAGGALSKGVRAAGDFAAARSPRGAGGIQALAGGLGMGAAVLSTVLGATVDFDKKQKEVNKSILNTFGSLQIQRVGAGSLEKGIRLLNHTFTDLQANMGVSQEEAMALFDTLDKGGHTLTRIAGDGENASNRLRAQMLSITRTSQALGVSLSEYAQSVTDYTVDLGSSLEDVNNSFSRMADLADRSSFSTRRLFSMVTQATSSQSSLNVRLEDTGDLLMKMQKILGQKAAQELVTGAGSDVASMSGTDRARLGILAGSRGTRIARRDAQNQAVNFAGSTGISSPAFQKALAEAGARGLEPLLSRVSSATTASDREDASAELVKALSKMTASQQGRLTASLESDRSTEGLGRRLSQLIDTSRATTGLGGFVANGSALSASSSIQMRLASFESSFGRLEDVNSVEGRVAAENVLGVSGPALDALREVARVTRGQFDLLKQNTATTESARREQARRFGATTDENNVLRSATVDSTGRISYGQEITQSQDLIAGYMDRNNIALDQIKTTQEVLMQNTFDATVSVADILENKVVYYLRSLYENFGVPILRLVSSLPFFQSGKSAAEESAMMVSRIGDKIASETRSQSNDRSRLNTLRSQLQTMPTTDPRRSDIQSQISSLESSIGSRANRIGQLQNASKRLGEGNTWDIREGRGRNELLSALNGSSYSFSADMGTSPTLASRISARNALSPAGSPTSTPAPTPSQTPTGLVPSVDSNPVGTQAVSQAVTQASETQTQAAQTQHKEIQKAAEDRHRQGQQHLTKILTKETKLGDALARSRLPQAIVDAQVQQQVMALATSSGLTPEQATEAASTFMSSGRLSSDFITKLMTRPDLSDRASALGIDRQRLSDPSAAYRSAVTQSQTEDGVEDFIYRGGSNGRGVITPISTQDEFVGMKPGGPVDRAMSGGSRGSGGVVHVNIHGGSQSTIYRTVVKALSDVGIRPSRD